MPFIYDEVEPSIEKKKANFKGHEIKDIVTHKDVQIFEFRDPNSSEFWFKLITTENLIAMTGDCYTLVIEPGYGRSGLAFLRGSVNSVGYFLGKAPYYHGMADPLHEFSPRQAVENLKEYVKDFKIDLEDEYEDEEDYDEDAKSQKEFIDEAEAYFSEGSYFEEGTLGEIEYYDFLSRFSIDEPMNASVMTNMTALQVAGLQVFKEKYEKREEHESGER